MAIKPIDARLDELEYSATPKEPLPEQNPFEPQPVMEPEQVAGFGSVLRGVLKAKPKKFVDDVPVPREEPPAVAPSAVPAPAAAEPVAPAVAAPAPVRVPKPKTVSPPPPAQLERNAAGQTGTGKPSTGEAFNLDLTDDAAVSKYIQTVSDQAGVDYSRVTLADVRAKVEELGITPEWLAQMGETAESLKDLPVTVLRAVYSVPAVTNDLMKVVTKINAGDNSPETMTDFLRSYALTTHVLQQAKNIQVAPAQALAVLNQGRPILSVDALRALAGNEEVSAGVRELANALDASISDAARLRLIERGTKVGFVKDLWLSTWINGLLSSTATPVVNITSNAAFALSQPFTRLGAAAIGSAKRGFGMTASDQVYFGEALAGIGGYVQAAGDAFSLAWRSLKTGTTREQRLTGVPEGGKTESRFGPAGADASQYGFDGKTAAALSFWSKFVSVPGRVLQSTDEAFKALAYRFELNAQVYRDAMETQRRLVDDGMDPEQASAQVQQRITQLMADPPDNIDFAAQDFSKMLTFTRDLDGAAARVQEITNANVLAKTVMPFVRTPTWITSEGLQHSFFAPLSKQWRNDVAAGGAMQDLALAKFGLGSMAMTSLTSLAVDGRITGSGPGNKQLRQVYQRDGWRPYSLVLNEGEWDPEFRAYLETLPGMDPSVGRNGKLYISLRGFEPMSGIFAMAADYVEYARYEEDDDKVSQAAMGALFGLYQYVGQSPYMQGLSGMVSALGSNSPNPRQALKDVINQFAQNMTEFAIGGSPVGAWSAFQAQIERFTDGTRKDISTSPSEATGWKGVLEGINRWKSRTPGLSADLPDKLNRWAEPDMEIDPARPWLGFTGIRTSESKMQPVDRLLISLQMPLGMPQRAITKDGVTIKLEPDEYNRLLYIYAKEIEFGGMGVQEFLVKNGLDPSFELLPLDQQQSLIKQWDERFMDAARAQLFDENPALQAKLEAEIGRIEVQGKYKR
jgi:hypothetical protein